MKDYITNSDGKWEADGIFQALIEPSEEYNSARQIEELKRLDQEKLNNLIPTKEEIRKAETELQIITLLQEVNLI